MGFCYNRFHVLTDFKDYLLLNRQELAQLPGRGVQTCRDSNTVAQNKQAQYSDKSYAHKRYQCTPDKTSLVDKSNIRTTANTLGNKYLSQESPSSKTHVLIHIWSSLSFRM